MLSYIDVGEITENSYCSLSSRYKNFDKCSVLSREEVVMPFTDYIYSEDPIKYLISNIHDIEPNYIKINLYIQDIDKLLTTIESQRSVLSTFIDLKWLTNTEKNRILSFCEKRRIFISKDRYSNSVIIRWP